MPKIRKKSSRRQPTRLREKITKKASEHRRKEKKEAKKDVTWKSKAKKDPGIPALFPFKERILEEVQESRRQKEAAKREIREKQHQAEPTTAESMAALAAESAAAAEDDEAGEAFLETLEGDEAAAEGTSSSLRTHARSLRAVLERSDVIIEVLDARDPAGTRSRQIERELMRMPGDKKLVLVLNKIDLVPRENVEAWLAHLRTSFPALPFKSSTQEQRRNLSSGRTTGAHPGANVAAATSTRPLITLLKNYARSGAAGGPKQTLICGVIGMPNVGKSSLINTLKRSKACGVAPTPGFTKEVQEVSLDAGLKILDCPGVVFEGGDEGPEKVLRNALRIEQVADPIGPVEVIMRRCRPEHLMMLYNIPAYGSTTDFLIAVARARGRLQKGGTVNLEGTARSILRDWNAGRIPYYTVPPPTPTVASHAPVASTSTSTAAPVPSGDVGTSAIVSTFAPAFDLDALFGEADAEALTSLKSAKDLRGKSLRMDAETAPAIEDAMDEDPVADGRLRLLGEGESDDSDDDAMSADDDDDELDAARPVSAVAKGKRKATDAALDEADGSGVVSLPPRRRVAFADEPLGPTPSGTAAAPSQRAKLFAGADAIEAPPISLAKRQKVSAKKGKKLERREVRRDVDGTNALAKAAGLLTVDTSGDEGGDLDAPYDFNVLAKTSLPPGTIAYADSDDEEL